MKPIAMLILICLFAASCSAVAPFVPAVLGPGDAICTSSDVVVCEELAQVADSLHTPAMEQAIRDAQAGARKLD